MSRFAFILACAMAFLASTEHSRLPPEAFAVQAMAAEEAGYLYQLYQLDPLLLVALAWEESRFDASLISLAGAYGATQVKPQYVPWRSAELLTPQASYRAGAWALVRWLEHCAEPDPLVCYNGGEAPGRASRWYAKRVRRTLRHLRHLLRTAEAIWRTP